jgi:hypothetical protein
VGRIRPEVEGLLGTASYCGSRPSPPHGPTGAAQQPLGPTASNRATRCGEIGEDSLHRKRGSFRARRDRQGRIEAATRRWGGRVGSGRQCSGGGAALVIFGVLGSCTGVNIGVRAWLQLERGGADPRLTFKGGAAASKPVGRARCPVPERPHDLSTWQGV